MASMARLESVVVVILSNALGHHGRLSPSQKESFMSKCCQVITYHEHLEVSGLSWFRRAVGIFIEPPHEADDFHPAPHYQPTDISEIFRHTDLKYLYSTTDIVAYRGSRQIRTWHPRSGFAVLLLSHRLHLRNITHNNQIFICNNSQWILH